MSSVIGGYSYDIFISYRQKDNKGEKWVSEFVEALRAELESTFKEEISVYFDINPHDGLLETHDVTASLKDKLKCLVFIPVLSRTYCDPNSFAWQHEFISFVEQASNDNFGLRVKLPHGNVATRVLPVRIHELDAADQKLFETVLGGVPRGVDFIFKSAGVNRPLRMNEDSPRDNLNHTFYRDQINKVANAIDEIISGLRNALPEKETIVNDLIIPPERSHVRYRKIYNPGKLKVAIAALFIIALCYAGYRFFAGHDRKSDKISIAFIPFRAAAGDYGLMNAEDNLVEAVRGKLSKIGSLEVFPRISTLQFRETELSMRKVRRQLKSDYYIGGRIWKEDGKVKIFIELSDSRKGNVLWQNDFSWANDNSGEVTNVIISSLTGKLKLFLTPDEAKSVFAELTSNAEANMNYLSGNARSIDSRFYVSYDYDNDSSNFLLAIGSYNKAIEIDPQFAEAYIGRAIASSWGFYMKQLDTSYARKSRLDIEKAAALDSNLPELHLATAFYYYNCTPFLDSALHHFMTAAIQNPADYQPLFYQAMVYRRMGNWQASRSLLSKVARANPREALFLTNIGMEYDYLRQYDSAMIYHRKATELMPGWRAGYYNLVESAILRTGKTREAWKYVKVALLNSGDSLMKERIKLLILDQKYGDALKLAARRSHDINYREYERYIDLGRIYSFLRNSSLAGASYDSARVMLERETKLSQNDAYMHGLLAVALAGTGNNAMAVEEAGKSLKLSEKNAMLRSDLLINNAVIYTMLKDYGRALDAIESCLSGYSQMNVRTLQLDPFWMPLYNIPEFKKILKKYSSKT